MGELRIHLEPQRKDAIDAIRINQRRKKIEADLAIYKYVDKDTNQIVIYIPSLELTGYGEVENKAIEMLQFSIDNLFNYWINLSPKFLKIELSKLGWKQNTFRHKEYSKAFVDENGELRNFAVDNKVEKLALSI